MHMYIRIRIPLTFIFNNTYLVQKYYDAMKMTKRSFISVDEKEII